MLNERPSCLRAKTAPALRIRLSIVENISMDSDNSKCGPDLARYIGSMQRHRFTGTIKSLPLRMPGIRFEIGQFDHHPVRCAWAIGADLNAD
jgi:hypothetical protein